MSKVSLQKLRMVASEADDLLSSCDASDLLDGLEVARDFMFEAASMIEELESRLAQVERERDAAVYDIAKLVKRLGYGPCRYCRKTYDTNDATCSICVFEWRGVCPENTKEEK